MNKLNPVNTLFGKIFFWFWLTTIILVVSAVWIAKQSNSSYTVKPIKERDLQRLESLVKRVERFAERRSEVSLSTLLGRAGQRHNMALMLYNDNSKEFIYGFARGLGKDKPLFMSLLQEQTPFSIRTGNGEFYGPILLQIDTQTYRLFAGRPLPKGSLQQLNQSHPGVLLVMALLISGALCAWLTWSLIKPIRALQKSAKSMAQGDLKTRVEFASRRTDELGQLGKDFNHMAERVETLLGSQRRLVADVSHELRSPLARLQLAVGIAQDQDLAMSELTQKQFQRIEKETHQINEMIERILHLSRLEADAINDHLDTLCLSELLKDVLQDADFEAQSRNKELSVSDLPELMLTCYPQLLASALRNVIGNAIKYATMKVEISFTVLEETLCIVVSDDGSGIAESELEQIFVPFYRVSASRNRDSGGVGLGLAIAQQAIAANKGTIKATNNQQSGLRVTLIIPIQQQIKRSDSDTDTTKSS